MTCSECGYVNQANARFCRHCGVALSAATPVSTPLPPANTCWQCGALLRGNARFCNQCGVDQRANPIHPSVAPEPAVPIIATVSESNASPTTVVQGRSNAGHYRHHAVRLGGLVLGLVIGLTGALIYDLGTTPAAAPAPIALPPPASEPAVAPADPSQATVKAQFTEDARFGLMTTTGSPDSTSDDYKALTFDPLGSTNNTRIWIDGETPRFGEGANWLVNSLVNSPHWEDGVLRAIWSHNGIEVEQAVAYVTGSNTGRVDTIRVAYQLTNRSTAPHRVGLRLMLDTLIGDNDGVPFVVPGRDGITDRSIELVGAEVPDFVQALEYARLTDPGVIVQLTLQGGGATPPDRVVIAPWCSGEIGWEYLAGLGGVGVPLNRCNDMSGMPDSAIGLYFDPHLLEPGETRSIVQYYGLGSISSTGSQNARLSLAFNSTAAQGARFWISALVMAPQDGQTVRLTLPPGVEFEPGFEAEQSVAVGGEFTQISWQVRAVQPLELGAVTATLLPDNIVETQSLLVLPVGITR